jgi:hypothetical protein
MLFFSRASTSRLGLQKASFWRAKRRLRWPRLTHRPVPRRFTRWARRFKTEMNREASASLVVLLTTFQSSQTALLVQFRFFEDEIYYLLNLQKIIEFFLIQYLKTACFEFPTTTVLIIPTANKKKLDLSKSI